MINDGLPPASCSTPNKSMFSNANKGRDAQESDVSATQNLQKWLRYVTTGLQFPQHQKLIADRIWKVIVVGKKFLMDWIFLQWFLEDMDERVKAKGFLSKICKAIKTIFLWTKDRITFCN